MVAQGPQLQGGRQELPQGLHRCEGDGNPRGRSPGSEAGGSQGRRAEQREYRPLPPRCERALSAGYWPGQTTPPVRTGPAGHAGEPPPCPTPPPSHPAPPPAGDRTPHQAPAARAPAPRPFWSGNVWLPLPLPHLTGRARPVWGGPHGRLGPGPRLTVQVPSAVQAPCLCSGQNHRRAKDARVPEGEAQGMPMEQTRPHVGPGESPEDQRKDTGKAQPREGHEKAEEPGQQWGGCQNPEMGLQSQQEPLGPAQGGWWSQLPL